MTVPEPGRGLLFDSVVESYARVRPAYPDVLFGDLAAIAGLGRQARVLEVGCGTGLATRGLLANGWTVTAVEPGAAMAGRARSHMGSERLAIEMATFEGWEPAGRNFDLVFSATAFHWVSPVVRWHKAASILEPAGHIALATNNTVRGGTFTEVYDAARELHARAGWAERDGPAPTLEEAVAALGSAPPDIGLLWGAAAEPKAGFVRTEDLFEPPVVRWYPWEAAYTSEEAVLLLGTYSPYLALPVHRREPLLAGIRDLIDERFDGRATRRYLSVLAVARRR
jgi:SAM-dependent methyltransferase